MSTLSLGAWLILIGQAFTLATAALAFWSSRNAAKASKTNTAKIQEIHVSINSRMDELVALTAKSSHAEGMKDERDGPR